MEKKPSGKGTRIREYLLAGLVAMAVLVVLDTVLAILGMELERLNPLSFFIGALWVFWSVFVFVNAIRHLRKYKEKWLAVISLAISGIIVFVLFIAFCIGIIIGIIGYLG